mmetsp:Transcript_5030/g.10055  ORF Transcript_5030/g.10055 Transcript_5030/m.10055 type:complete len:280 (-) Transcript_5030:1343-2182(-)
MGLLLTGGVLLCPLQTLEVADISAPLALLQLKLLPLVNEGRNLVHLDVLPVKDASGTEDALDEQRRVHVSLVLVHGSPLGLPSQEPSENPLNVQARPVPYPLHPGHLLSSHEPSVLALGDPVQVLHPNGRLVPKLPHNLSVVQQPCELASRIVSTDRALQDQDGNVDVRLPLNHDLPPATDPEISQHSSDCSLEFCGGKIFPRLFPLLVKHNECWRYKLVMDTNVVTPSLSLEDYCIMLVFLQISPPLFQHRRLLPPPVTPEATLEFDGSQITVVVIPP